MPKKLFLKGERDILKKYIKVSPVDSKDQDVLREYAEEGFVSFPKFDWDTMKKYAILTPEGLSHLNR